LPNAALHSELCERSVARGDAGVSEAQLGVVDQVADDGGVVSRCHLLAAQGGRGGRPAGAAPAAGRGRRPACAPPSPTPSPTCSVRVSWTGRTPPPRWPRIGAGRTICQRRWSGRCERPSPARHWRRGRRGDLRAWPPVRDGRRLTHPPAHRVSGPFRSGSVIAPMPAGRDPADHELGEKRAKPGHDQAVRHTRKKAGFMTNDELQAMVRDELFWDPRSTATRSPCRQTKARSPYEHGEGQAPRSGCQCVARQREPGRAAERGDAATGCLFQEFESSTRCL
jgi:hypothetical protein